MTLRAHRGGHLLRLDAEDARADEAVQVLAGVERLDQARVPRQVRHDAHLDLRVVGGQQRLVALADLERGADAAALLGADRDVLQVRVGAREAAGLAAGLDVGRVDPAVGGDRRVERLDDLPQLRRLAVLQQQIEERMRVRLLQVGEHGGIRRIAGLRLAGLRQLQLVEEHLLQLLGRAEVHLVADRGVGRVGGLDLRTVRWKSRLGELGGVDSDPGLLHPSQQCRRAAVRPLRSGRRRPPFEDGGQRVRHSSRPRGPGPRGLPPRPAPRTSNVS